MNKKAIFLDKDGTLIENIPYQCDDESVHILPGVITGLRLLKDLGFIFIIVTNQSAIEKKVFSEKKFINSISYLQKIFSLFGIPIQANYYCPHSPDLSSCLCRKPKAYMLYKAQKEYSIDLKKSWMIGDILNDIECGNKAKCKTILINNGNETEWKISESRKPKFIVDDFLMASFIIAAEIKKQRINEERHFHDSRH